MGLQRAIEALHKGKIKQHISVTGYPRYKGMNVVIWGIKVVVG